MSQALLTCIGDVRAEALGWLYHRGRSIKHSSWDRHSVQPDWGPRLPDFQFCSVPHRSLERGLDYNSARAQHSRHGTCCARTLCRPQGKMSCCSQPAMHVPNRA